MRTDRIHAPALLLAALLLAWAAVPARAGERTEAERRLDLESFDWIWTTIRDRHFDPTLGGLDWSAVRDSLRPRVDHAGSRGEARAAMERMISLLGQSHFQIIPAPVLRALGQEPGEGTPGGSPGLDARVVDGRAVVVAVEPGSPADSLGVRPGWEIARVGAEDLAPLLHEVGERQRNLSWKEADLAAVVLSRIEGRIGDTISVRFRDGRARPVDCELRLTGKKGWLAQIGPVSNVRVWLESRRLPGDVGCIAFNLFLDPARLMPAFESALRSLRDARGIVIDVRGNQGGMIPIAMGMAGWLVDRDHLHLGTFRFRDGELRAVVNRRVPAYEGPVAVLVDGLSLSCAEAFAGGLQDLGRARVFGSRTAGMVLHSAIERLPNGDAFQYVFASYRSAKGTLLEGRGVVPDVTVPLTREALLRGEDPALQAAADWIRRQVGASRETETTPR